MFQLQNVPIDYKPWGMQAGGMVGEAEADNSAGNLLNMNESILNNIVKQKEAALAQDEMNNQAYRDARIQGLIGKSQQDIAKGKVDMGTADSDITAKVQENITKAGAAKTMDTINRLDNFLATAQSNGPAGIQIAMSNLDPAHQQEIAGMIQQYGVNGTISQMSNLSNMLKKNLADSVAVRGKIAETEATGKWHKDVANIQGSNQRQVEQMRIDAGKYEKNIKSSSELWIKIQSLSPDKMYVVAQSALAANRNPLTQEPLDALTKSMLEQAVTSSKAVLDQKAAATAAGNPNAVSAAGVTGLPAQSTPVLPGMGGQPATPPPKVFDPKTKTWK